MYLVRCFCKINLSFSFFLIILLVGMSVIVAHVAQLVEHFLGKGEVTGSNPVAGSR